MYADSIFLFQPHTRGGNQKSVKNAQSKKEGIFEMHVNTHTHTQSASSSCIGNQVDAWMLLRRKRKEGCTAKLEEGNGTKMREGGGD